MMRLFYRLAVLHVLSFTAAAGDVEQRADIKPREFPAQASYTAHLVTNGLSKLCQNCTFIGKHAFNAKHNFGLVQWVYGETKNYPDPQNVVDFMDVFLGDEKKMYLISSSAPGPHGPHVGAER